LFAFFFFVCSAPGAPPLDDKVQTEIPEKDKNQDKETEIEQVVISFDGDVSRHHSGGLPFAAAESHFASNLDFRHSNSCNCFKILSFNIWNLSPPWEKRLKMLQQQIGEEIPDIIGLQEVRYDFSKFIREHHPLSSSGKEESTMGKSGRWQIEQLKDYPAFKDYQFVFQPAMTYLNLQSYHHFHVDEGLAIFTKFPMREVSHKILSRDLTDSGDAHQRICLRALIEVPGCGLINFLVTHLTLSDPARERTVMEIEDWVNELSVNGTPAVLVGDFNTLPSSPSFKFLIGEQYLKEKTGSFYDAWTVKYPNANSPSANKEEKGLTFPTWNREKRIDFVLVRENQLQLKDIYLIGNLTMPEPPLPITIEAKKQFEAKLQEQVSSDHVGLVAVFDYNKEQMT
jgi:endonuclease/exonuclease/phosphatase family metal-dependent hydrolase